MLNHSRTNTNPESVHIPKKEVVKFIIKEILQDQKISSQAQLAEIISKKLKKGDRNYTISGKRARLLAAEILGVGIFIQTKKGPIPKKCPCCEHRLRKSYIKNLSGRRITVKLSCPKCSYKGSDNRWIPKRYEFEYVR